MHLHLFEVNGIQRVTSLFRWPEHLCSWSSWKSCLLNCCWINTAASKARQCKPVSAASCQDSREGARVCRSYCFHILLLFIYTERRSVFPCHPVVAWSSLKSWQTPGSHLLRGRLWSSVSGILGSGLRLQDLCSLQCFRGLVGSTLSFSVSLKEC